MVVIGVCNPGISVYLSLSHRWLVAFLAVLPGPKLACALCQQKKSHLAQHAGTTVSILPCLGLAALAQPVLSCTKTLLPTSFSNSAV